MDIRNNRRKNCPLCRLVFDGEVITRLVHEDSLIIVVDCTVCQVPMAVLKHHRPKFTEIEKEHVRTFFRDLIHNNPLPVIGDWNGYRVYGDDFRISSESPWVIDWEQRNIPGHAHCHLRPQAFPGTFSWESLKMR